VKQATNNQAYQSCINTACANKIAQPVQNMVGHGVAQKNVGCLMELYEDVLQNVLHLISQFNWIGANYSAAIIMIFVSCSNIYGYLQNYQDCLTLAVSVNELDFVKHANNFFSFLLHWTTGYDDCLLHSSQQQLFMQSEFLAASTECSAGSNDHFVVAGGGPSLVQFDGRPLGGAYFQY
jgi:hypothetical protein